MNDELTSKPQSVETLYGDVCQIIDGARSRIATYLNTEVCMTNWCVGKRIKEDVLFNQRAEYGKQVIKNLSARLTERYGRGWSEKHLRHCLRSAETFSEEEIVSATQRQLTWTHLKTLVYIKDPLERQFYAQMCGMEHWDTRTLDEKIANMLVELQEHPRTGTGQVEHLKHFVFEETWSRRINKQYRMIYEIHDTEVFVSVISLRSHYGEKRALSSRKTVASYITFRLCLHG